jgi:hypothetical protein
MIPVDAVTMRRTQAGIGSDVGDVGIITLINSREQRWLPGGSKDEQQASTNRHVLEEVDQLGLKRGGSHGQPERVGNECCGNNEGEQSQGREARIDPEQKRESRDDFETPAGRHHGRNKSGRCSLAAISLAGIFWSMMPKAFSRNTIDTRTRASIDHKDI